MTNICTQKKEQKKSKTENKCCLINYHIKSKLRKLTSINRHKVYHANFK